MVRENRRNNETRKERGCMNEKKRAILKEFTLSETGGTVDVVGADAAAAGPLGTRDVPDYERTAEALAAAPNQNPFQEQAARRKVISTKTTRKPHSR